MSEIQWISILFKINIVQLVYQNKPKEEKLTSDPRFFFLLRCDKKSSIISPEL